MSDTPPPDRSPGAADFLGELFPGIAPSWMRGADPCWIAWALAQTAEHNPPIYWLGRAFEDVSALGGTTWTTLATRLRNAHGDASCGGRGVEDASTQEALTALCATAWAHARLGPPAALEATLVEGDPTVLIRVPSADAVVVPYRVQPEQTLDRVVQQIQHRAAATAELLRTPPEAARDEVRVAPRGVLYVDLWHERRFAQSIGYRFEITEPVQTAVRHLAPAYGLGYVLTRPFEWGRPLEEWA